jgi:hypothetical protein
MATKNEPVEAHAVIGQIQACRMTRSELMTALTESGFGERDAVYRAFFRKGEDGAALCNTCGLQIGHHADRSDAVAAVAAEPVSRREEDEVAFPPPDCTVQQYSQDAKRRHPQIGASSPYPPHWVGAAWYAPLIDFVGHSRNESTVTVHKRKNHTTVITTTHALLKYRCTIEDCGKVFEVEGPRVDNSTSAAVGPVSLKTMGNGESIEAHMERVHGLKHLPAGRIATRLFDCCKDPAVAMTCCVACLPFACSGRQDHGLAPCCAIARVFAGQVEPGCCTQVAIVPRGRSVVSSAPLDEVQCHAGMLCNAVLILAAAHGAIFFALGLVGSIVTLCGFPCNSDSLPPILCSPCYGHRRTLVQVLDADETPFQSRVKATFCCYCSEVQVWRELKASGVWPGLLCCTASEEDREYMSASAVRQRFSVDGAYAVRATSAEGERLLPAVRERLFDTPAPNLCYGMK